MSNYEEEVALGQRFQFGANWARFLSVLNDERIDMLEAPKAPSRQRRLLTNAMREVQCGE